MDSTNFNTFRRSSLFRESLLQNEAEVGAKQMSWPPHRQSSLLERGSIRKPKALAGMVLNLNDFLCVIARFAHSLWRVEGAAFAGSLCLDTLDTSPKQAALL